MLNINNIYMLLSRFKCHRFRGNNDINKNQIDFCLFNSIKILGPIDEWFCFLIFELYLLIDFSLIKILYISINSLSLSNQ